MIDTSCFRAFQAAAQTLNFTEAARKVGMTQSGVSQHVARLEEQLASRLFERIQRKVKLTESGLELLKFIEREQEELNSLHESIRQTKASPVGLVRYAMPHTCLFTPHFEWLLAARKKKFDQVDLQVELLSNDDVLRSLLDAKIDFGFSTKAVFHPNVQTLTIAFKEYVMVGPPQKTTRAAFDFKNVLKLPFIQFPGMEEFFDIWSASHFSESHRPLASTLYYRGRINNLHGAMSMIESGMGFTVLPEHMAEDLVKSKKVSVYEVAKSGAKADPKKAMSEIQMIWLKNKTLPNRVKVVMDQFHSMRST